MAVELEWSPAKHLYFHDETVDIPLPDVASEHLWIWRAWHRLHQDRPWYGGGMGPMSPGSIPFTAVVHYCEFHQYTESDVQFLDTCLQAMDAVFIKNYVTKANTRAG